MDLSYSAADEAFRAEIRAWLEEHLPAGWFEPGFELSPDDRKAFNAACRRRCTRAAGSARRGQRSTAARFWTTMQGVVLTEEFSRAKAPLRADFFGDTLVRSRPSCNGAPRNRRKTSCRRILNGTMRWCQGFSEPNSGSDLASFEVLRRARRRRVDHQRTEGVDHPGHHANYCSCSPARSRRAQAQGHLLPAGADEPARRGGARHHSADGTAEFCEVFFDNARCPKDNVVGGVNNGWKVANSTLAFERGVNATTGYRRSRRAPVAAAGARERGLITLAIRQRLAVYYSKIRSCASTACARSARTLKQQSRRWRRCARRHEQDVWSETHKAAMELALDIFGAEAMLVRHGRVDRGHGRRPHATKAAPAIR